MGMIGGKSGQCLHVLTLFDRSLSASFDFWSCIWKQRNYYLYQSRAQNELNIRRPKNPDFWPI
jgi:hypothetical protein